MARPKVYVQHLVACLNAAWDGPAGVYTPRTLERVGYWYAIPPDTEFPFEGLEFWIYARLYRRNAHTGMRDFALEVFWHDFADRHCSDRRTVARFGAIFGATLGRERGLAHTPADLPGRGDLRFRLLAERARPWGSTTP